MSLGAKIFVGYNVLLIVSSIVIMIVERIIGREWLPHGSGSGVE